MTRPVGTATWVRGSGGGGGAPMSWMGSEGLAGGGRGAPVFRAVWAAGRDWPGLRRSRSPRRPPFRAPQRRRGGGAETALYKVRKPARGGGSGGADLVPPRPRGRGGGARARAAAYKRAAPALPPGRAARAATLRLPFCGVSPGLLVRLIHARLCSALPRVGRARAPERPPPCSSPAPLSPSALVQPPLICTSGRETGPGRAREQVRTCQLPVTSLPLPPPEECRVYRLSEEFSAQEKANESRRVRRGVVIH